MRIITLYKLSVILVRCRVLCFIRAAVVHARHGQAKAWHSLQGSTVLRADLPSNRLVLVGWIASPTDTIEVRSTDQWALSPANQAR